jgi:hypothetical protein
MNENCFMKPTFVTGDQVVGRQHTDIGEARYRLGEVEAVTQTGQVRPKDRSRFTPDGNRIGSSDKRTMPATEDNLTVMEFAKALAGRQENKPTP